jgi:hypothetical protein
MWSSAFTSAAMTSRLNQGVEGSITSPRLEALLDKLVAVQLDLDPISRSGGVPKATRLRMPPRFSTRQSRTSAKLFVKSTDWIFRAFGNF